MIRAEAGECLSDVRVLFEVVASLCWNSLDYLRAVYQIGVETIFRSAPLFIRMNDRKGSSRSSLPELEDCTDDSKCGLNGSGAHRDILGTDLECVRKGKNKKDSLSERLARRNIDPWAHISRELEPAFLSDDEYPEHWLVYHPLLRVVPKVEADRYELQHEKEAVRFKMEKESSFLEEKKDDSAAFGVVQRKTHVIPVPRHSDRSPEAGVRDRSVCEPQSDTAEKMPLLRSVLAS
jgi:hypothetical protein